MTNTKRSMFGIVLTGILFLVSNFAFSVGLQPLVVESNFGETLDASIKLIDTGNSRPRDIRVSFFDYRSVNRQVSTDSIMRRSKISYRVERAQDRSLVLKFSSDRAIQERRLAFTIQVTDRFGRTDKRRYMHVIPGTFVANTDGGTANQRVDRNTLIKNQGIQYGLGIGYAGAIVSSSDYDNLWDLALQVKAGYHFSVYQVMMAIFEANIAAFSEYNINTLLKGKQVIVPSFKAISRLDRSFAIREVAKMNYSSGGLPVQLSAIRDILRLIDVADVEETYADVEQLDVEVIEEDLPSWVDDAVETIQQIIPIPTPVETAPEIVTEAPQVVETPVAPAATPQEDNQMLYIYGGIAAFILLIGYLVFSRGRSGAGSSGVVQLSIADKLDLAEGYLRMNRQQDAAKIIKEIENLGSASDDEADRLQGIKSRID